jgi:hypothetical protein
MGEEQLISTFKSVGQVVGFRYIIYVYILASGAFRLNRPHQLPYRLVFDRDTGKPKGYGFCEFAGISVFSLDEQNLIDLQPPFQCRVRALPLVSFNA